MGLIHHSNQPELVYLKDLFTIYKCVKYSKVFHFANDTNMPQSNSSLQNVAKRMNFGFNLS